MLTNRKKTFTLTTFMKSLWIILTLKLSESFLCLSLHILWVYGFMCVFIWTHTYILYRFLHSVSWTTDAMKKLIHDADWTRASVCVFVYADITLYTLWFVWSSNMYHNAVQELFIFDILYYIYFVIGLVKQI